MEAFYNKYSTEWPLGPEAVVDRIRNLVIQAPETAQISDISSGCSGWLYWTILLQGYTQYLENRGVSETNIYIAYLHVFLIQTEMDPTLRPRTEDTESLKAMVQRRLQVGVDISRGDLNRVDPVAVVSGKPTNKSFAFIDSDGHKLPCSAVDGIHRLFWAMFWRLPYFPYLPVKNDNAIAASLISYIEKKPDKTFADYCRLGHTYSRQEDYDRSKMFFEAAVTLGEQQLSSLTAAASDHTAKPTTSPSSKAPTSQPTTGDK
jgi:hypothetical protein